MSPFRRAQLGWDLRSGLLVRPFLVIGGLAVLAQGLTVFERGGGVSLPAAVAPWLATEPGTAEVVLATLAGSMMTVVSVIYTILVVALTLASMQFSPRILASFLRSASTQWTLGLVAGTFAYDILVLRAVRLDPPFTPQVAIVVAVTLALASLGALVWFIHHIANGIQANHLVDRIAEETERIIDGVWPARASPEHPPPPRVGAEVTADRSGYVQLIDVASLRRLAAGGRVIALARGMGRFVAEGSVLARVSPESSCTPAVAAEIRAAFDLGPIRTMQDDVEWGFRQIVDIGLKAISPAVNDPSTAGTCIDQLTRLLGRAVRRHPPASVERHGTGQLGLVQPTAADLVDLSFEQLRQYGGADMAVALRLMRAFAEVGEATRDPAIHTRLLQHANLLERAVRARFADADCDELASRLAAVHALGGSSRGG